MTSIILLRAIRKAKNLLAPGKNFAFDTPTVDFSGQAASNLISQLLTAESPAMIARFGYGEIRCVYNYVTQPSLQNIKRYINGEIISLGWEKDRARSMSVNAGFFPANISNFEKFSQLMIQEMKQVDILGSWLPEEHIFHEELSLAKKVKLSDLEPYYHQDPWTNVLKGKKILVVHPFEESIRRQYKKRKYLFKDERILPEFDLKVVKAVQSIANNNVIYKNWFEALDSMKEKIIKEDFDIALIGCGAYGFPLAGFVKSIGKKSVHIGGAVQVIFGIKGARWDDKKFFQSLYNEHWIRPVQNDFPENYQQVEGGCYW
ncbi:hypothetical protein [Cesiribacter sp. SM1]|uniref:hypothetical protein n=1 Tax=Cesiribacter sp. SM1 TaxID=2861196 RepID=UPI001CD4BC88|nr:hypothetical protein [Cesiribacter sp. SM1]